MKKVWMLLLLSCSILTIVAVNYLESHHQSMTSGQSPDMPTRLDDATINNIIDGIVINRAYASAELKNIAAELKQCSAQEISFSGDVSTNHQIIIDELQLQLRQGVSERELLGYADQYELNYKSYNELLWQAKVDIAAEKYTVTPSINILEQWHGVRDVLGITDESLEQLVESFGQLSDGEMIFTLPIEIKQLASKEHVLQLANNTETFNTYLDRPFSINGTRAVSPSIFFVLNSEALTIDEFEVAVSTHQFTADDLAMAIKHNVPFNYIKLLFERSVDLKAMPVFIDTNHAPIFNLADLAASHFNIEVLNALIKRGVMPTNEPGILTAMDLALENLPTDVDNDPKYSQTINRLIELNYHAHGRRLNRDIEFLAPTRRRNPLHSAESQQLFTLLNNIKLIDEQNGIEQISSDESSIARMIAIANGARAQSFKLAKMCRELANKKLAKEQFSSADDAYEEVAKIKKLNKSSSVVDSFSKLHDVDPVLVNLLQQQQNRWATKSTAFSGLLMGYIRNKTDIQVCFDYVTTAPLSRADNDLLFELLLKYPIKISPLWHARINEQPPSSFKQFIKLPLAKWQLLLREKFDFSMVDRWGNDLFAVAMLNSNDAYDFLLKQQLKPSMTHYGLDVFDIALEQSYLTGSLAEHTLALTATIENIEPSHFSRVARLRHYFPNVYQQLVENNPHLIPASNTPMNQFHYDGVVK